jgi:hypothetical protein
MFGLEGWQNLWLAGFLVAWAALLFGGFLFGRLDDARERRMPRWTRIGSSLVLVVVAWSWVVFTRDFATVTFALLIAAGMTFGFIGDLFMADLIPVRQSVIGGIAAFGIGHILYIAAFLNLARDENLDSAEIKLGSLAVWWLLGLIAWYLLLFRGQARTAIHWMALGYTLLLSTTAGLACALALQDSRFVLLAIGAALFLLSDLILALRLFANHHFYLIDDVVWLTYGPAQCFIVCSVYAVLRLRA